LSDNISLFGCQNHTHLLLNSEFSSTLETPSPCRFYGLPDPCSRSRSSHSRRRLPPR
jgi:hypothetical protein